MPIECQLQTKQQFKDQSIGFAAHSNMPGKQIVKPKVIPPSLRLKLKQPKTKLEPDECEELLEGMMRIAPFTFRVATTQNDFEATRTEIIYDDLYNRYRKIVMTSKDSETHEKHLARINHLKSLYNLRRYVMPRTQATKYLLNDEIPNLAQDPAEHQRFMVKVRQSLSQTMAKYSKIFNTTEGQTLAITEEKSHTNGKAEDNQLKGQTFLDER